MFWDQRKPGKFLNSHLGACIPWWGIKIEPPSRSFRAPGPWQQQGDWSHDRLDPPSCPIWAPPGGDAPAPQPRPILGLVRTPWSSYITISKDFKLEFIDCSNANAIANGIWQKKSCIRETKHLSTDADSSTDAIGRWTKNTPKPDFFWKTGKVIKKNAKKYRNMPKLAICPLTRGL